MVVCVYIYIYIQGCISIKAMLIMYLKKLFLMAMQQWKRMYSSIYAMWSLPLKIRGFIVAWGGCGMPFLLSTSPGSRTLKGPTALQLWWWFCQPVLLSLSSKLPHSRSIQLASASCMLAWRRAWQLLLHPQLFSVNLKNTISLNVSLKIDHPFPVAWFRLNIKSI